MKTDGIDVRIRYVSLVASLQNVRRYLTKKLELGAGKEVKTATLVAETNIVGGIQSWDVGKVKMNKIRES